MKMKFIHGRDYKLKERGVAAVEFAIVISLLVLIIGGIIEFGRVLWYLDALTKATRDGARFISSVSVGQIGSLAVAATTPADCNSYSPVTANRLVYCAAVAAHLPGFTIGNVAVSCDGGSCTDNMIAPSYVTVTIEDYSVAFGSWFAIPLPSGQWPLTPHTTMRYMCEAGATTPC